MHKLIAMLSLIAANSSIDTDHINRKQAYCTALAVYHEARGENITGQSAVAHVVQNRVQSPRYPDTACKVVHQPSQFSYIDQARPRHATSYWNASLEAAIFAMTGITNDPTGGALYYHNPVLASPAWRHKKTQTARIDDHVFYR